MKKKVTLTANNMFALLATLLYLRVPFEFVPHKAYNDKRRPNDYGRSVAIAVLEEGGKTQLAHILWSMNEKYFQTFDLTVLKEEVCE